MTVGMGVEQQGCAGTISEGGDIWEKLLEEWEAMSLAWSWSFRAWRNWSGNDRGSIHIISSVCPRDVYAAMLTAALFTIAQIREQSKWPSEKEWVEAM